MVCAVLICIFHVQWPEYGLGSMKNAMDWMHSLLNDEFESVVCSGLDMVWSPWRMQQTS